MNGRTRVSANDERTARAGNRTVRVVDYIAAALAEHGVGHVFGVGGANIEDLFDALHHCDAAITGIVAKHEFSAATMADGYARAGRRLGVMAATSGGGMTNLVSGLAEAYASRIPVLALVGQPPAGLSGLGVFQDSSGLGGSMDAHRLLSAVSRFCARVDDPVAIPELLAAAIEAAQAEVAGPAVLLLPKDVQQAALRAPEPVVPALAGKAADQAMRRRAAEVLRSAAGSVLIIAGEGVASADAHMELSALAAMLGAWVAVAPDAKDVYDNRDPRFVGVAGTMGSPTVADCARRAAACLVAGSRLPVTTRSGLEQALAGKPVVCVNAEPPFLPGERVVHVSGHLRSELDALAHLLAGRPRECPPHPGPRPLPAPPPAGTAIRPTLSDTVGAIAAALPQDAHVFVDAGNAGAAAIHLLPAPARGRFVVAVGMGGMGYTFGAGIGAAFATGQRTYVLAGDGAFFMHGLEVHTAVEYDLPVTYVICNNNAHAMCLTREQLYYGGDYSYSLFAHTDIAAGIAAMFPDLNATRADTAAQLCDALRETNGGGSPAFVCIDLDPNEIPPFAPFLAAPAVSSDVKETADEHRPVSVG
jgi:acetolactate synthase I/II/III large subunit